MVGKRQRVEEKTRKGGWKQIVKEKSMVWDFYSIGRVGNKEPKVLNRR